MDTPDLRTADKALLALALQDARNYTIALLDDWRGWKNRFDTDGVNSPDPRRHPYLAIINPPLWELGLSGIRCGGRPSAVAMMAAGRPGLARGKRPDHAALLAQAGRKPRVGMRNPRYRNHYEAQRDDIFVGLRCCPYE